MNQTKVNCKIKSIISLTEQLCGIDEAVTEGVFNLINYNAALPRINHGGHSAFCLAKKFNFSAY